MKIPIKIFFALFVFSFGTRMLFSQECKVDIKIETDLDNSSIYIDENLVGNGNVKTEIEKGTHIVKVSEPEVYWNAEVIMDTIEVTKCDESINLSYAFSKKYFVRTNPHDAAVYEDGELIGHTPLSLAGRSGSIILKKRGFADKEISLMDITLGKEIPLNYIGEEKEKSFFEKDVFKVLLGSLVVLGGTTAYFKLKADDKYDEYEISGEQKLLDDTRKYDLISGITLGLLEINFGVLIYYFLTD